MSEWLQERRHLEKYDGSNKIRLNREGNPYQSGSLCKFIRKRCEQAGVKTEDRKVVWYSLRQTMGRNVRTRATVRRQTISFATKTSK